ncbi:hypothetical protein [Dasania marina]|uniref:hypothetical protein n=1 Tax=Dasania marina TaxID=471499 RepID=UPI0004B3A01D|nr:hypothetical protein [Dasania marina]
MSSGVLAAKFLSLTIIALLISQDPDSALHYFEISIYSGLLGALFLLGVVFGLQVDGFRVGKFAAAIFSFLIVVFVGLSISVLLDVSAALALSSVLSSVVAVTIAYAYRNSNYGPKIQLAFVVIQQPAIFIIASYIEKEIKCSDLLSLASNSAVYLCAGVLLLSLPIVVSVKVSLKSIEVFLVCLMTYLVVTNGLEVSPDSSAFYVWLAVQIGGATVFVGNSISYYLMEHYRRISDGKVAYYYKVYDVFLVASFFLFLFVIFVDTNYDEFMYAILLTMQGLGKAASSIILTSEKYWTISVANILSAGFLFLSYQYVLWDDFRTTIIVLIAANFISVLWIVASGRLLKHG